MPVLERSELEASPLADLHAIADQVGVDGFKRLRKADLIDKILAVQGGGDGSDIAPGEASADGEQDAKPARKRRLIRPRRGSKRQEPTRSRPSRTAQPTPRSRPPPTGPPTSRAPTSRTPRRHRRTPSPRHGPRSRSSRSERWDELPDRARHELPLRAGTSSRTERGTSSRSERGTSSSRGRRGGRPKRRSGPPRASSRCCQTALRSCAWIRPSSRLMTCTSPPPRFAAVSSSAATA